ncbi:EAL domain-containing protein [Alteromonas oceanisediminis]|uniref:EAL domain-containing protein n=1 Tax=Alteromonas oceanisediminis TaxID=2836180 RepID=UPI001BDB1B5C|nr:EAL domain-containing protein [Alteromonas oceanisediminis]MBT0586834.1 EAL domain-containing protein [Alteromonas oceanisediminis]
MSQHTLQQWLSGFWVLVFVACLTAPLASAQDTPAHIHITDDFSQQSLRNASESLRSPAQIQLSDVKIRSDWQPRWSTDPLSDDQRLWIRTSLRNDTNFEANLLLTIAEPSVNAIDVFVLDDKNRIVQSFLTGSSRDFALRPIDHRHFVLPFSVMPRDQVSVYIRVADDGHLLLPVSVYQAEIWLAQEQAQQVLFGCFIGALFVFTLYFLVTYSLLRSSVRFWFSVTCLSLLLAVLNIEGFIGQLSQITSLNTPLNGLLLAMLMFSMAKVSRNLFANTPKVLRLISYSLPTFIAVNSIFGESQWLIQTNIVVIGLCIISQSLMAIHYRNRFSSSPSKIYLLGWLCLVCASSIDLYYFTDGSYPSSVIIAIVVVLSILSMMCIGVAIEANEKVILRFEQSKQEERIDSLKQFYQLFRNSAEGLYTSTPTGDLVSVNPAMWQLFGYDSESDMLSSINNTNEFYANKNDRDVLIGELLEKKSVLGREFKGRRKDGTEFWFSLSCQLHSDGERTFLYGSIFDVTERKQSNISLEYLATHDSLTGVYNRREFERQLQRRLQRPFREHAPLTMLYLDLDQFKVVNDTCGHKAGDVLLQQLAHLIDECVGKKGLLSRLGGDEFGVLMADASSDEAFLLANRLLNVVSDFRFMWENRVFSLGVSIGLVERAPHIGSPEQMMSMADAACYIAKERGRNQIHRYSQDDVSTKRYENELNWLEHINTALETDRFCLYYQHYQPLHESVQGHRYELLLRMQPSDGDMVPPGAFLPAAERYSLGAKIDRWVIHHYFQWLGANSEHQQSLIKCNINLCGQSLADRDFKLFVLNAFEKFGVSYSKICFEITEGMAIIKMDETLEFIKTFSQLGCTFALDDFGSGFSSYGYLKQLPVQYVKIDGGFVRDMLTDPIDMAMVSSINDVAKAIGMQTVAEFVESSEIKVQLGKMGVDFAQGYGIATPQPLLEFAPFDHNSPRT